MDKKINNINNKIHKLIKWLSVDFDIYIMDNQTQCTIVNTEFGYIMSILFSIFIIYGVVY